MNVARHIPNSITCLNLVSGGIAIIYAFADDFDMALAFLMLSAVFDFLDGLAARVLIARSDLGKELDSLADIVSFGLAPSLILYSYLDGFASYIQDYVSYIPLVLAAFSGLRLAKFNNDTRQQHNFLGLPVPASAMLAASFAAFAVHHPYIANQWLANNFAIPGLAVFLSALLVSEIPMFSLKFKSFDWKSNSNRYLYIIITIPAAASLYFLLEIHWTGIVLFASAFYLLWNLTAALLSKLSDK